MFAGYREQHAVRLRGFKAGEASIQAVEAAVALPFDEGLAVERRLYDGLIADPQFETLRRGFLAERAAARLPDGVAPASIPARPRVALPEGDEALHTLVKTADAELATADADLALLRLPPGEPVGLRLAAPNAIGIRLARLPDGRHFAELIGDPSRAAAALALRLVRRAGGVAVLFHTADLFPSDRLRAAAGSAGANPWRWPLDSDALRLAAAQVIAEAAALIQTRVAARPSDIDLLAQAVLDWPPFLDGPGYLASAGSA